jgi:hypothetical protein
LDIIVTNYCVKLTGLKISKTGEIRYITNLNNSIKKIN